MLFKLNSVLILTTLIYNGICQTTDQQSTTQIIDGSSLPPKTDRPPATSVKAAEGAAVTTAASPKPATGTVKLGTGSFGLTSMSTKKFDFDPRIGFLFSQLMPGQTPEMIFNATQDISILLGIIEKIMGKVEGFWESKCNVAMPLYDFLLDEYNKTKDSSIDLDLLKQFLPCKKDCTNFDVIINGFANPNKSDELKDLAKNVMVSLPPAVAATDLCKKVLGKYLAPKITPGVPLTATDIEAALSGSKIPISSVIDQNTLGDMSPAEALKLVKLDLKLDFKSIASLGPKIPASTPLLDVVGVAPGLSPAIFNSTDPEELANLTLKMPLDLMSTQKKNMIAQMALKEDNPPPAVFLSLMKTGDPDILKSIPIAKLISSGVSLDSIPIASRPPALNVLNARETLKSKSLSDLKDVSALTNVIAGMTPTDIEKIPDNKKKATAINIAKAAEEMPLSSVQRTSVYSSLVDGLKSESASTSPSKYFGILTSSDVSSTNKLFIEAPSTDLEALSALDVFDTIIANASTINETECCKYKRSARLEFTKNALKSMGASSSTSLTTSQLDTLGTCFASALPNEYLATLDSTVFSDRIWYFQGSKFQVDSVGAGYVTAIITKLVAAQSDKDSYIFETLKDLAVYYSSFSTISKTELQTSGSQLLSDIDISKNPTDPDVQLCRLGLAKNDDTTLLTKITDSAKTLVDSFRGGSKRKRRATHVFTCSEIKSIGTVGAASLTTAEIGVIAKAEFEDCIITLGSSDIDWSRDQLTALATRAKEVHTDLAAITYEQISNLNKILLGFSTSDLAKFPLSTLETVSKFGSLTGWTSDQLTTLATTIKTKVSSLSSSYYSGMSSINCGLTESDINAISTSDFNNFYTTLSTLDTRTCPSLSYWYNKAKTVKGDDMFSSSTVTELGSLFGGISASDVSKLSSDVMALLSDSAMTLMSADAVNSFTTAQWNGLSTSQANSLANSPSYSSFSQATLNALSSLTSNTEVLSSGSSQIVKINVVSLVFSTFVGMFLWSRSN